MSPLPPTALLVLLLVFVAVVCEGTMHASALNATTTMGVSPQKMERIQRYLEKINKPAEKSIRSPDGDIIDCVLMNKQLALDHPLLRNHKIQTVAPKRPASRSEAGNQQPRNDTASRTRQAWNHVENCPDGTVSVRRTTVEDVLRAGSLSRFGRKKVHKQPASAPNAGHEYAVAEVRKQQAYGTKAIIDVWDPSVENSGEFSLSQIWLSAGSYAASDLNTIEVGWQVLSGNSAPRLFVYWTRDAYASTGCYNLMCPGFVQTNNQVVIGGAITPVSTYGAGQSEITLLVWKDSNSGNWWLSYQNIDVGYWPAEIFTNLASYATTVQWGGEIVNKDANGQHTTTQMGSGHFAEEGYQKASYFRNVEVVNSANALNSPRSVDIIAGNTNCYDIKTFSNARWGFYFFYGGPGRNSKCP